MIIDKQVFTYQGYGFTKFVEMHDIHWTLKILSNQDGELIFNKDYLQLSDTMYIETDVKTSLDEYIANNMKEFDKVGAILMGVMVCE